MITKAQDIASLAWPDWLEDGHSGVWLRLRHALEFSDGFSLHIVICEDSGYQQKLIAYLESSYGHQHIIDVTGDDDGAFIQKLNDGGFDQGAVHLIGTQHWFQSNQHVGPAHRINYQRETMAATIQRPLLIWLHDAQVNAFAHEAPDAWAWRSTVFDFTPTEMQRDRIHTTPISISSNKDLHTRQRRLEEISEYLEHKAKHGLADISLLLEQSRLFKGLGQLDESDQKARLALALSHEFDDIRHAAMGYGLVADILQARGNLDEALRIRQEEELPVYEKLGDVQSCAVTMGNIADILQARGNLDEALRIRQEEQLPVYEKLGDVRARAVTMGKIADILWIRGNLNEAFRTLNDEVFPAFEKLGDVRARAVTKGKIADILQARGNLDEALRIRQEEEIPVYEKLGDVRSRAITIGKIADILRARGCPATINLTACRQL